MSDDDLYIRFFNQIEYLMTIFDYVNQVIYYII